MKYRAVIDGTAYGNVEAETEAEALSVFADMYSAVPVYGVYLTPAGETLSARADVPPTERQP